MDWLGNWNKAMEYIENHLEHEIDMDEIAKLTCCSPVHFQRMFSYLTDVSVAEYIRRRKMSKAAAEIQKNLAKIIDVALKYGYDSPTAFNRAFQSVHGIAPSKAKKEGVILKAYLPISFNLAIKGDSEMNYRMEQKDAFRIVGIKTKLSEKDGGPNFLQIPGLWQENCKHIPELCKLMSGKEPIGVLGVTTSMNDRDCDYYIAVASEKPAPANMHAYEVPAAIWAIFDCVGAIGKDPCVMRNLQKRIFSEWLPASGYEYANAPDIEVYFEGDLASDDYHCEVWLPVIKK